MNNLTVNQRLVAAVAVGLMGYTVIQKTKRTTTKRRWWVRPWLERRNQGRGVLNMVHAELRTEDQENYKNFLRMTEENFSKILNIIREKVERRDTQLRECISAEKRLSVTLRFLATGETFKSLSFSTRIAQNTLSKLIPEVLAAIVQCMGETYLTVPHTQAEWQGIAEQFYRQWNFPNCLGALDGKHIVFRPPRSTGSFYRNYKGTDSIVLLALVGPDYTFLYTDIGTNGRISDGGVFSRSQLATALQTNSLNFPSHKPLPGRELKMPFVIVADDAFPLQERIMKPYRFRGLTNAQKIYNYRVSRARRIVENAFGILANRFRVLLNAINLNVEKVELITTVCCILHNFLIEEGNTLYLGPQEGDNFQHGLSSLARQGGNRVAKYPLAIRQEFRDYFNANGAVEWQQERVDRNVL